MPHQPGPNETTIARVRVNANKLDPLAARLRLARILNEVRLRPRGLPASAIVFVKKLRDPMPGALNLSCKAGPSPAAWEDALGGSLDELARSAARPALGYVPANAECVWFLDRSELLASLAVDWREGSALTRWWWRSLFRATDITSAVISEWLSSIEYAPAAIAKLAEKDKAVMFVGALPAREARRLLDDIARHFGLAELRDVLQAARGEPQPAATDAADRDRSPRHSPPKKLSSQEAIQLRTRWAPEAFAPRLDLTGRLLLAAALLLERAPAVLRARGFASVLVSSLLAGDGVEGDGGQVAAGRLQLYTRGSVESPAADNDSRRGPLLTSQVADRAGALESPPTYQRIRSDPREQLENLSVPPATAREPESAPNLAGDRLAASDRDDAEELSQSVENSVKAASCAPAKSQPANTPEAEVVATTIELSIETRLGGVFYLINAALAMELYGDFTRPLEPGIELSIWDFLALMGRELIGEQFERDPIWRLLAKVAGREEGELPGARFKQEDDWRMPPDWLNAFPERRDLSYGISRGRLVVMHSAGFSVLDVKLGSRFRMRNIQERLARELGRYSNVGSVTRSRGAPAKVIRRELERSLDRWTRRIADYLRVRLARSTGAPVGDLARMFFARAARVDVSPARLDVFFLLAELPIEIRLAGLDRDPGWLPAAGRAIAFHYD